jgi:hypothetical protein
MHDPFGNKASERTCAESGSQSTGQPPLWLLRRPAAQGMHWLADGAPSGGQVNAVLTHIATRNRLDFLVGGRERGSVNPLAGIDFHR